jgi:hypothetical protein
MSWVLKYEDPVSEETVNIGFLNATGSGKTAYAFDIAMLRDTAWAFEDEDGYRLVVSTGEYNGKQQWRSVGVMREEGDGFKLIIWGLGVVTAEPRESRSDSRRKPQW